MLRPAVRVELRKLDLRPLRISDTALDELYLTHPDVVAQHLLVANIGDQQVGLVYEQGNLVDVLGPGEKAFYAKRLRSVSVELVDAAADIDVAPRLVGPLARLVDRGLVLHVEVPSDHVGLLYVDGVLDRQLTPGRYAYLRAARRVHAAMLDLRLQALEVTGRELLTRDRVGVRVNATALYRIGDPARAVTVTADFRDYLYKELQLALRQVIGTRSLDEVLGDKEGINAAIAGQVVPNLVEAGLVVSSVGVKDIVLPGDMRELMNRVVEAEKTAQANVIRRREETAATRSLLNTAKLMEDNPILLRLKELKALERVSEKIGNVIVGNGMDGVLDDLVRLRPRDRKED